MTLIRPFAAIRPTRDKVHLVASRSYVSYSVKELREKLKGNPFTFLHVIHPDLGSRKVHKTTGNARHKLVREAYEQFKEEQVFLRDEQPQYYIYRQIKNGHPFTGLLAAVAIEEYLNGNILIHEHTLSRRESTFTEYLGETAINAEPVLLFHPDHEGVSRLLEQIMQSRPEYDFTTTNKVHHQLWCIDKESDIDQLTAWYGDIPKLFIADGHHRCASSAALYKKWNEEGRIHDENHPATRFLAFILAESNMRIYPFSRLIRDLSGVSHNKLMNEIGWHFHIRKSDEPVTPSSKGVFGMYLGGGWYELELIRQGAQLDADILYEKILSPVLKIGDQKKDQRIAYMEGPRGVEALEKEVNSGRYAMAFTMCPVQVDELKHVAEAGECMPPKSTWVEPKLRSGLVVHELYTPIEQNILQIRRHIPEHVTLVAVSKFQPVSAIMEAYRMGIRDFAENYVQEMEEKRVLLPNNIRWHFIGHLQRNKVKYIAPYVECIHSVDSQSLWAEISKQAEKHNRRINVLLQVRIAEEETKFGIPDREVDRFFLDAPAIDTVNAPLCGLMGMASFTDDEKQLRMEFTKVRREFKKMKENRFAHANQFSILSMGMSSDWKIAVEEGSNLIRIGTTLFGARKK
jgi:pyridoxal phosphate enzyme (YggS family)